MPRNSFIPKNNPPKWIIPAIILIAIAAIIFFFGGNLLSGFLSPSRDLNDITVQGCRSINRANYGIIPDVFSALPSPPKCFHSVVEPYHAGTMTDDLFFTRAFYLQPEFYPEFLGSGQNQWLTPNVTHWGIVGYGSFPIERSLTMQPGETKKVRFFIHAGFGVRTYQGMSIRLSYKYPDTPKSVQITLDEDANKGFLLGPTFPQFETNWVKVVDATIHVAATSPPQNLEMTLISQDPIPERAAAFARDAPGRYYDATAYVGARPLSILKLNVRN